MMKFILRLLAVTMMIASGTVHAEIGDNDIDSKVASGTLVLKTIVSVTHDP